jgi:hypothetical protein
MSMQISRRNFLKLGALGAAGLAFNPLKSLKIDWSTDNLARVALYPSVSVYSEPSDQSTILYQRYRDEIVNLYYDVTSDQPPKYNPHWYRVWGGYIHSAHLQKVKYQINPVSYNILKGGVIAQVTVPYTQSYWDRKTFGWEKSYRLYYQSMHWIVGVIQGPDGEPWYQVLDQLLRNVTFYAKAEHFRLIPPEDFTPIHPNVSFAKKRIEVSIETQTLTAYEGDQILLQTKISSGMPDYGHQVGAVSTNTPLGEFNVYSKMPSKHMGDGNVTSDLAAYEIPGVPWTTFFADNGVAFHGTYWHNNFGRPMSHGCVNMRIEEAQWIFRWTTPVNLGDKIEQTGYGTRAIVY